MPRPSEYRAHYGAIAESRLAEGARLAQAAAGLCVSVRTLRRWMAQFPEFADAVARGQAEGSRRRAQYRTGCGDIVEARLSEGASAREVAAEIGVSHSTLMDWRAAHAEFAEAWARGLAVARRQGISQGTRYRPHYCETAVTCLAKGYSLTVLADELGVSRKTLQNWIDRHAAFAEAVERGLIKGARLWERRLEAVAAAGSVNAIIFALKRIDPECWDPERVPGRKSDEGGNDARLGGKPITRIENVFIDPAPRTAERLPPTAGS